MKNMHADPANNILFPMLFIVISCGAISGFHATQSPMMARCMTDEKYGRPIFYGAMISEGIVAMIWATAAMAYFGGAEGLNAAATAGKTPAIIVDAICNSWLGRFGAIIAIIGVVVCPITSGDTAFRSMRLIIADALKFNQKPIKNRLIVSIPIFIIAYLLCNVDFSTIWKYVGIGNQVLATITLWTAATYLAKNGKAHWMMSIPATFLSIVCTTYFLIAPYKVGGLYLSPSIGYPIGAIVGIGLFVLFFTKITKTNKKAALHGSGFHHTKKTLSIHSNSSNCFSPTSLLSLFIIFLFFHFGLVCSKRIPIFGQQASFRIHQISFRKKIFCLSTSSIDPIDSFLYRALSSQPVKASMLFWKYIWSSPFLNTLY